MKREIILISSYLFIILIFFIIGYFIGKNRNNKFEYGLFGIFIGVIACLILWSTFGEKYYKKIIKDIEKRKNQKKEK